MMLADMASSQGARRATGITASITAAARAGD